jgi:hypothetical protein
MWQITLKQTRVAVLALERLSDGVQQLPGGENLQGTETQQEDKHHLSAPTHLNIPKNGDGEETQCPISGRTEY